MVYSKSAFAVESWCLQQISFCSRVVLFAANQCLLSKSCCLQPISFHYQNRVVCNKSVFAVEIVMSIASHFSKLNHVVYSESVFSIEIVLSAANQCLLPKLCCLQQISVCCRNCVVYSESAFAALLCCCSELAFFVELRRLQ